MKNEELKKFLLQKYGQADYHFTYDHLHENSEIHVLVFLPLPEEGIFESTLLTIECSSLLESLERPSFEFIWELRGTFKQEEYLNLGKEMLDFLFKQIKNNGIINQPSIYSGITLSKYPNLTSLLCLNYGKHDAYFWETNPPVQVLEFIPLYEDEHLSIQNHIPEMANVMVNRSTDIDWNNWDRSRVDIIHSAVSGIWSFIKNWYKNNSPKRLSELKSGAPKNALLNLEKILEIKLPQDFKSSLLNHNGEVYLHDYQYLTIEQIKNTWLMMNELLDADQFKAPLIREKRADNIREVWWHKKWIPFAKDGGGNLMCIDLVPTDSGNVGQIIYWEKSQGPIPTQYKSFIHWLWAYEQGLYKGYYKIDEEGFIYYE